MSVFRVEKNRDYTVMANHHLRNRELSLKAKGLLSLMLSLPNDWDYTLRGLAAISKDGIDSVRSAIKELEAADYVTRERLRSEGGRLSQTQYTIFEVPPNAVLSATPRQSKSQNPNLGKPRLEKPIQGQPTQESHIQLNTKKTNTQKININSSILQDDEDESSDSSDCSTEKDQRLPAMTLAEREEYRELIEENIGYQALCHDYGREEAEEIAAIMTDAVCSRRASYKINNEDIPTQVVKSRFLTLNQYHVSSVLAALRAVQTPVVNTYGYIITSLYNVKTTMNHKIRMDLNQAEAGTG